MKKVMLFLSACALSAACLGGVTAAAEQAPALARGCKAAYLCDWQSGTPVFEANAREHLPVASMCKIMTLVLCFEELDKGLSLGETIAVSEHAAGMGGSQVFLEAGGEYPAGALIESICIASANDSSVAMAERIAGSEQQFVARMNERARQLGMKDTCFVNCTGLPAAGQYCCAHDAAVMLSELLRHAEYFAYSKIWTDTMQHPGDRVTEMANTNKLIRTYRGCDAGKTGYTSEAGFCLAASAVRGDMRAVAVVIGAPDSKTRFDGAARMFDHVFANYTHKTVLGEGVAEGALCPVKGGKKREICVRPSRRVSVFCAKEDAGGVELRFSLPQAKAPVAEGEQVGSVAVYKDGVEYDVVPLLANEPSPKSTYFDALQDIARGWGF